MEEIDNMRSSLESAWGKPCIQGLRITVYDVLEYLASGMSRADLLREFPYLKEIFLPVSPIPLIASAKWKSRTREAPL